MVFMVCKTKINETSSKLGLWTTPSVLLMKGHVAVWLQTKWWHMFQEQPDPRSHHSSRAASSSQFFGTTWPEDFDKNQETADMKLMISWFHLVSLGFTMISPWIPHFSVCIPWVLAPQTQPWPDLQRLKTTAPTPPWPLPGVRTDAVQATSHSTVIHHDWDILRKKNIHIYIYISYICGDMCIDTNIDIGQYGIYIYYIYIYHISPCAVMFYRLSLLLGPFARECRMHELSRPTVVELARKFGAYQTLSWPSDQDLLRSAAWDPLKLVKLGQHHWEDLSRASQLIPVDKSCIVLLFPLPFLILEVGNLNKNTGKTMELELFDPFFSSFLLLWSF